MSIGIIPEEPVLEDPIGPGEIPEEFQQKEEE